MLSCVQVPKIIMADSTQIQTENVVVETQNQLMTLVDEGEAEVATIPMIVPPVVQPVAQDGRDHTITDFLCREVRFESGLWETTHERGYVLRQISFPHDLMRVKMYRDKLSGFRYLSGTIEVKIIFNAQPFQAGIVRVAYMPLLSISDKYNSSVSTMTQISGLNGEDINLENQMPLVIEIPYIYPLPTFDMVSSIDPFALMRLVVYSPLSVGSVNYTIFTRFKDVNVSMPTSQDITSIIRQEMAHYVEVESDDERNCQRVRTRRTIRDFVFGMVAALLLMLLYRFRSSPIRARKEMGSERKATGGGTVTNVIRAAGNLATTLSGIPVIGSASAAVGSILDAAAGLTSLFGWSKPKIDQVVTIVRPKIAEGFNNYNVPESTHQMALDVRNCTNVTDGKFGTALDEMSISSLVRVPQFIAAYDIATTTPVGTCIAFMKLNPMVIGSRVSEVGTKILVTMTNMAYVASLFELWRGSLRINFKIAKTQYHSMRLAIVWHNRHEMEKPIAYMQEFARDYSIIWDIRETFEQTVVIPYIQPTEWLNMDRTDSRYPTRIGYVGVYLINGLVVGGSATNTVEMLTEVFGGHDLEFAIPRNAAIASYFVSPITAGIAKYGMIRVRLDAVGETAQLNMPDSSYTVDILPRRVVSWTPTSEVYMVENKVKIVRIEAGWFRVGETEVYEFYIKYHSDNAATNEYCFHNDFVGEYYSRHQILYYAKRGDVNFAVMPLISKIPNTVPTDSPPEPNILPSASQIVSRQTEALLDEERKPRSHDVMAQMGMLRLKREDVVYAHRAFDYERPVYVLDKFLELDVSKLGTDMIRVEWCGIKLDVAKPTIWHEIDVDLSPIPDSYLVQVADRAFVFIRDMYLCVRNIPDHWELWLKPQQPMSGTTDRMLYIKRGENYHPRRKFRRAVQEIGKEEALLGGPGTSITGRVELCTPNYHQTTGESIVSLRQLAKRYSLWRTATVAGSIMTNYKVFMFDPFEFKSDNVISDYLSHFAPLYRFYNGDVKYKIVFHGSNYTGYANEQVEIIMLNNFSGEPASLAKLPSGLISSRSIQYPDLEGMIEFTVPYYNRNPKTVIGPVRDSSLLTAISHRIVIRVNTTSLLGKFDIYRAMGENFTFGTTLSAPTLLATTKKLYS